MMAWFDPALHLIESGVADDSGIESILQLLLRDLLKNRQGAT
ncbi:hypothetical protein [Paraburkholderia sediminicola]